MKQLGRLLLLLALPALLAAQNTPASVEGIVTDLLTGGVVPKATLDLQSTTNPNVRYPAVTAGDGRFIVRNVLPGNYSLMASRTGYVRSQYGQRGPNSNASNLVVVAGTRTQNVQMWMVQSGAISGRLLDVGGEPVSDAQIHAWKISYRDGWRVLVPVASIASNDLGEYRLFGLPPGPYYVTAQPEPRDYIRSPAYAALGPPVPGAVVTSFSAGQSGTISDPAITARTAGKDYAPVYYGGTTDQFMATQINLTAGADLRGMDIAVVREPMGTLGATLFDATTSQPLRASLVVTPIGSSVPFTTLSRVSVTGGKIVVDSATVVSSTPAGQTERLVLPRGRYLLSAFFDLQGRRLSTQAAVDLRDPTITNVRMELSPVPDISGSVRIEGRPENANDPDIARMKVGLRSTISPAMDAAPQAVSASGAFTLRNVTAAEHIVVISTGMEKGYVKSIQMGNTDVLNEGLQPGSSSGDLRIVIGTNPGTMTGVVRTENGTPLSNVTVALLPDEYHRNRLDLYQNVFTDSAGKYRFNQVPPGAYRVFAWEDVEKDSWRDPSFMRLYENRGKGISVGEGASTDADLDVIRIR